MREVAVVSFAQTDFVRRARDLNEVELLMPVVDSAMAESGLSRAEIGFTVSGSADYLSGLPFSFVGALDAIGAWPPISESHVEMDGAWALYEAWVMLQEGSIDAALIYCFGKSSSGSIRDILSVQTDPYYVAPLKPDSVSMAALQARALLDSGDYTEADFAEVARRSRSDGKRNPSAQVVGDTPVDQLLAAPYLVSPLRRHDCPPISDGAAAIVLAAGDLAHRSPHPPAWIRGIDHRIEPHSLGARDLTRSPSTRLAAERAGVGRGPIDVAEIYAPFTHQELILRRELGFSESARINPSGGALAAHALMVAGLVRIGEAARQIHTQGATRVLAHATSGPCLQQNLVCVLEAS